MGWRPLESEPCLFQKKVGDHVMRLVIHVDDGAVSGPDSLLQDFVRELREKVKITFSTEVKDL